ncbi:MAG: GDSL-type esterase/lipase family protein [Actinomycetia bacterium]|nr:GDSL-type esterase/lipase family protein [Actinomycetes bacterium]
MSRDLRVCFLGDSFVAGTGDPEHLGWVGRLTARTHRGGSALTAYNLGVRRQTSSQVLDRWLPECSPRLPEGCEGRVVVSFGVNDTTVENGRQRVSTAESAEHLTSLLRGVRAAGWTALVVGPPPVADQAHNLRTATLAEHLRAVAAKENTPYVATLSVLARSPVWMAQVNAGDGAHPAAEGYTALADLLWPRWAAWLAAPATS